MTSSAGPFLIICHEATRTGASKVVVDLLEAARPKLPHPLAVRLLAGGPLAARVESLADVEEQGQVPRGVFVNSALAVGELASVADAPTLVWVHEEADALAGLPPPAVQALTEDRVKLVFCVSETSRRALEALGVPPERITLLPPVVPRPTTPTSTAQAQARASVGATDIRLVIGCGEASWRKGVDHFIEVARRLTDHTDIRFAWVGRRPRGFARQLDHDRDRLDRRELVHWVGEVADPSPFLATADLLLMTSREDPQPLVPLESAHLGTATLAFHIGGLGQLAAGGAAASVVYPDTGGLTDRLVGLLDDEAERSIIVKAAAARARAQLPEKIVPRFVDAVRSVLADVPGAH